MTIIHIKPSVPLTITKIERQKKNRGRCNIYVDDVFFCGLYDDTVLKYGLAANDEITEQKLNEIKEFDEYIYGKKIAFDYLAYRIRTAAEIRKKLKAKSISAEITEKILKHLTELNLIDDAEFAKQLISEKIKRKPAGKTFLKQKLFEKGISKEIAEKALEEAFENIDEKEVAMQCFLKYYPKVKPLEKDKQRKKIFDTLARKGFDYDIINQVIREKL